MTPPPYHKPSAKPPPPKRKPAIHIQTDLIAAEEKQSAYTSKILAPIYLPKNKCPHVIELVNTDKAKKLVKRIQSAADISAEEKQFCKLLSKT